MHNVTECVFVVCTIWNIKLNLETSKKAKNHINYKIIRSYRMETNDKNAHCVLALSRFVLNYQIENEKEQQFYDHDIEIYSEVWTLHRTMHLRNSKQHFLYGICNMLNKRSLPTRIIDRKKNFEKTKMETKQSSWSWTGNFSKQLQLLLLLLSLFIHGLWAKTHFKCTIIMCIWLIVQFRWGSKLNQFRVKNKFCVYTLYTHSSYCMVDGCGVEA